MTNKNSNLPIFLAGSLALNLFLVSAGTMHFLSHRGHDHHCARSGSHPPFRAPAHESPGPGPQALGPHPDRLGGPRLDGSRRRDRPGPGGGPDGRPPHARLLRQIVTAMGGPEDPRAHALLLKSRSEMKVTRDGIARAQQSLEQAVKRDPYDAEAMKKALEDLNAQRHTAQGHGQELLLQLAGELTPQERKQLTFGALGQPPRPRPVTPEH